MAPAGRNSGKLVESRKTQNKKDSQDTETRDGKQTSPETEHKTLAEKQFGWTPFCFNVVFLVFFVPGLLDSVSNVFFFGRRLAWAVSAPGYLRRVGGLACPRVAR